MFNSISWPEYILAAGSATALWYLYVFLRYSRRPRASEESTFSANDRSGFIVDGERPGLTTLQGNKEGNDYPVDGAENDEDLQLVMQTVVEEIRACIFEVGEEGKEEELVPRLEVILSNYQELKKSAFKKMIDEFIIKEAKTVGFEYWDNEYVETFWK